jgi:hypothetical protein
MRALSLSLLVITACGARSSPTWSPDDSGSGSGSAAAGGRTRTNLPVALVQATEGLSLFVEDFTPFMLFADERLAAQQIIADWATANGLTIIAPATIEDVIAKANRGLAPDTGAACGPSLSRELAVERWVEAAGHVKAAVYCKADCQLQLEIRLRGKGTEFFASGFDTAKPWRDELALQLASVVDNGGHERYGHANNPVPVAGIKRGTDDLIGEPGDVLDLGADEAAIAQQCGLAGLDASVLVDAGAGGATRCERYADPGMITETDPTILACVCDKVAANVKPTRRQIVHLDAPSVTPGRTKTNAGTWASAQLIGGNEYRTFGVAWFTPGQIDSHASHCFVGRTAPEEDKEVNATIEFDRDGRAHKAMIADVNGLLQPAEHACLQTVMKTLRTPCPAQDNPTGTARISWRISEK